MKKKSGATGKSKNEARKISTREFEEVEKAVAKRSKVAGELLTDAETRKLFGSVEKRKRAYKGK